MPKQGVEKKVDRPAIRFLYIANGSIAEVITQLYIAFEIGYIEKVQFDKLIERLEILSKQVKTLISYRTASDKH